MQLVCVLKRISALNLERENIIKYTKYFVTYILNWSIIIIQFCNLVLGAITPLLFKLLSKSK